MISRLVKPTVSKHQKEHNCKFKLKSNICTQKAHMWHSGKL